METPLFLTENIAVVFLFVKKESFRIVYKKKGVEIMNSCIWILLLLFCCNGNSCGSRCGSSCDCNPSNTGCGCARDRGDGCGRDRNDRRDRDCEEGCGRDRNEGCSNEPSRPVPPPPRPPRPPFEDCGCNN